MAENIRSAQPHTRQKRQKPDTSYVYLLHFSQAIGNDSTHHGLAQHYIGLAPNGTIDRVLTQISGQGAAITRAAVNGYRRSIRLARTWSGGGVLERKLKNYKNAPLLCPLCNPGAEFRGNFYSLMHFEQVTPEEIERRIGRPMQRRRRKRRNPSLSAAAV